MKKKILIALTAVFVLGLAAVVFAFNQTNNSGKSTTADCCQKSDSCPMKNGVAKTDDNQKSDSCCDKADCCCKGDACPMKKQGESASANCCASCCGDSCPMKDKQAQTSGVETKNVVAQNGESCCQKGASCCNGGACCKHKG